VAEQFAAAAADVSIQAGRPRQALPSGELVDVPLRRVLGHRQARGRERARGDRAGCRRPGACQGTNIARRSTAGTAYSPGWASTHLEPGLFVTAFTYLLDRLQDTGAWTSELSRPARPGPPRAVSFVVLPRQQVPDHTHRHLNQRRCPQRLLPSHDPVYEILFEISDKLGPSGPSRACAPGEPRCQPTGR
jgi:hypothetical protein